MRRGFVEYGLIAAAAAIMAAFTFATAKSPPSTYSTFDTGPNGYRALYDVLLGESVDVRRLELSLAQLPPDARVLAATPQLPAFGQQLPILYDQTDVKRLQAFLKRGGSILAFGTISGLAKVRGLRVLDAANYTNAALARNPRRALDVYDALAGRGTVYFDERLHGYDRTITLWQVLPAPVRAAAALAILAVILALVEANVRFVPPIPADPPSDRDSSDYVVSMARLLRRARAGNAAIERFARAYPDDLDLQGLLGMQSDTSVLRAAAIYSHRRKDAR
jgi:hypothetical protein